MSDKPTVFSVITDLEVIDNERQKEVAKIEELSALLERCVIPLSDYKNALVRFKSFEEACVIRDIEVAIYEAIGVKAEPQEARQT